MTQSLFNFIGLLLILALTSGCTDKKETLVVATYTYSTNNRIANLQPFSKYLSETLGQEVETKSYPDVDALIGAIKAREVDIAFINTFGYLMLALDNGVSTPAVALKVHDTASDNYKTILLAHKKSYLKSLTSLKERASELRISLVNKGSTSGNLVPRLLLSSLTINNPDLQFKELTYAGDHAKSFQMLIDGKADLVAVGSSEYFKQMEADPSLSEIIEPIWISEEIPLGPVLLKNTLPTDLAKSITDLLLSLHSKSDKTIESIKSGWSEAKQAEKFVRIDDSYYNSFRRFENNKADLLGILNKFNQ